MYGNMLKPYMGRFVMEKCTEIGKAVVWKTDVENVRDV
jgi:hypothetical protein